MLQDSETAVRFLYSLDVLVLLMTIVAYIDWRWRGPAATKWREYGFLLIGGLLGTVWGVLRIRRATRSLAFAPTQRTDRSAR